MLSLYRIKPLYQKLFRGLAGNWMTPDMATAFGVGFALVVGGGFALGAFLDPRWLLLVPAGQILRMGMNALDGMLAREKGLASPLGAVLNEVTDVGNDMLCYAPLWLLPTLAKGAAAAFLVVICLAEFAGLLGAAVTGQRRYEGPFGGKTDRAFATGLFALIAALHPPFLAKATPWFLALTALVGLTAFNRVRATIRAGRAA